ncbi:MAG: tRNA dihydrouridine synthase DusB [Anaerolineae bacterium]|nr:tRNA dihydrouridine synthase DusB [Anaerolineae bacterium]
MQPSFYVRDVPVYGDVILAPMDGISDMPFRILCRAYGSAMSYTEFTNAAGILHGADRVMRMLDYDPSEKPAMTFQIYDADEDRIVAAAEKIEALKPDIIDLNMGCSVPGVSGRGAGAGLLRDPDKIGRIFSRLTKAVKVPVTGKIRLGWDQESKNYKTVAKVLEDNGASLIAVHGRTRCMAYGGHADWSAIAEIKQTVKIPVIGNGDVKTPEDIAKIKAQTGCDAVMIGRAAIGNPWIFQRKDREEITLDDVVTMMRRHLKLMLDYYGIAGLTLFRKHAVRYITGVHGASDLRHALVRCETPEQFEEVIARAQSQNEGLSE